MISKCDFTPSLKQQLPSHILRNRRKVNRTERLGRHMGRDNVTPIRIVPPHQAGAAQGARDSVYRAYYLLTEYRMAIVV